MNDSPPKNQLAIEHCHLGKSKALSHLEELISALGFPPVNRKKLHDNVDIQLSTKPFRYNPAKEIENIRKAGAATGGIQYLFDLRDKYLAPPLSMASSVCPNGVEVTMRSSIGKSSAESKGPGQVGPPEQKLVDSILQSRNEICQNSYFEKFSYCQRMYREYLSACTSLVEWFLNRYGLFMQENNMVCGDDQQTLVSKGRIDGRIDAWVRIFAPNKSEELKNSPEWANFCALRQQRNDEIHPPSAVIAFNLFQIVPYLNMCNRGIGGLLARLHGYTGGSSNIAVIHQILTAPKIQVVK